MKYRDFKCDWEVCSRSPNCASMATAEEPYLSILEVGESVHFTEAEMKAGIDGESLDFLVWEESLYERLIAELAEMSVPETLWPDARKLKLRWRFGKQAWAGQLCAFEPYWIRAELVEANP